MLSKRGVEIRNIRDRITEIHEEWVEEMQSKVPFNPKEAKEGSDYGEHHVVMDATWEQEKVFQDRVAPLEKKLAELLFATDDVGEGELLSKVSPTVDFHLAVNGDAVQMLVKHDFEEGVLSYRQGGEWIPVKPGDDLPALDEADLLEVIGEATGIWDEKEGGEVTLFDFSSVLLDEA